MGLSDSRIIRLSNTNVTQKGNREPELQRYTRVSSGGGYHPGPGPGGVDACDVLPSMAVRRGARRAAGLVTGCVFEDLCRGRIVPVVCPETLYNPGVGNAWKRGQPHRAALFCMRWRAGDSGCRHRRPSAATCGTGLGKAPLNTATCQTRQLDGGRRPWLQTRDVALQW